MNRRQLLKALAAGGVLTASGLWMPGQKLISIPKAGTCRMTGQLSVFFDTDFGSMDRTVITLSAGDTMKLTSLTFTTPRG